MKIAANGSAITAAMLLLCWQAEALAQRAPKPGFNLFTKQQDIQIGKEGAAEIEKQVKLLNNREVNEYIQRIGRRLAATPEADDYPYTFKVVHDDSINAFALPGGPTYVHTGLILAADNEAQLAGVIGHEIAHVALRHGTNQASKANLLQLGAILGGSMIGGGSITGQLAQLGIGFGANSVLLKFSRSAERDADILGARMMAQAGYNPIEAARFFEKLEAQTGKRSGIAEFFSSHPNPGNRMQRIQEEIRYLPKRRYDADTGQLPRIQSILKGIKPPEQPPKTPPAPPATPPEVTRPAPPATGPGGWREFRGREFALSHPGDWNAYPARDGLSVTIAPPGGLVQTGRGTMTGQGIVSGFFSTPSRQGIDLKRETESLIRQLQQSNPSMKASSRQPRSLRVDGQPALLTTLYSDSPFPGETEIDLLLTVARPGGLHYVVFVAPQQQFRQIQPTFETILQTIRFTN